jgi:superfamily II RNA helicase
MTSNYLITHKNEHPADWQDSESIKVYKYPLDYFQKLAVRAMNKDENVMACVATGSGKSTLADYAIALSFSKGKRVIFTSPIKALSNQKYKEFKDAYGESAVGLMTGDIKFNPDAPCLIMTAEILRNLLYKHKSYTKELGITSRLSLLDVDTVIMDEVHYINNTERGKVWEETLIMLPETIKLVLLSATIEHPEYLATWLGSLKKRNIHLISNTQRVIPLTHYIYKPTSYEELADQTSRDNALIPIMTNDFTWKGRGYGIWEKEFNKMIDHTLPTESKEYQKQAAKTYSGQNRLNNLIDYLKLCSLCPAICFVFSRKNCETYAAGIQESLITGKESAEIENIFHFYTHPYRKRLESLPQYYSLLDLLKKGVAYHHSGLVPILKEIIEIIFSKGFIKVLFATETFSVGLNMPTKTVVFLEFKKPEGENGRSRLLYTDEYLQMAGRAGRRGIDTKGYVIYLPMRYPEGEADVRSMMTGKKSTIKSKMDFGFDFIFKSLHSQEYHWSSIVKDSYWFIEMNGHKNKLKIEMNESEANINTLQKEFSEAEFDQIVERHELELSFKNDTIVPIKTRQRNLDNWKNRHIGKRWDNLYTSFKTLNILKEKVMDLQEEYDSIDNLELFMGGYATFLERTGFLQNIPEKFTDMNHSNLTEKGILATEINEGNSILMSELYLWYVEDRSRVPDNNTLLSVLSLFLTGDRVVIIKPFEIDCSSLDFLISRGEELSLLASQMYLGVPEEKWSITREWWYIVSDWVSERPISEIVAEYNIYEGNLTRAVLKITNLLEEWRNMATYRGDVWMLEYVSSLDRLLIRDIVIPDSLYVRN